MVVVNWVVGASCDLDQKNMGLSGILYCVLMLLVLVVIKLTKVNISIQRWIGHFKSN